MSSWRQLLWIKEAFGDNSGELTALYNPVSWKFPTAEPLECMWTTVYFKLRTYGGGGEGGLCLGFDSRGQNVAVVSGRRLFVGQVLSSWH